MALDSETVVPEIDLTWEEQKLSGPSATVKGFECGDDFTRSSWQFNGQKMVFGWEKGDAMGLFPTAGTLGTTRATNDPVTAEGESTVGKTEEQRQWEEANPDFVYPEVKKHPLYYSDNIGIIREEKSIATPFYVIEPTKDSQTQRLFGGSGDFEWDKLTRWTAYKPFNPNFNPNAQPAIKYTALPFDFSDQTQMGLTDMQALYQGKGGQPKGYNNPVYIETEAKACKHLALADFSVSPEMLWDGEGINFNFQHVGAIARLFMLAPAENLTLEKLELICDKKIFHTKGEVDITSHIYDADATRKGVKLVGDGGDVQMRPTDEASQKVTLNFPSTYSLKIQQPTAENRYLNYMVAYIMLYPIDYQSARDGNLYVYVTARDESNKEVHFVSDPLSDRNLKSGYYYEWTLRTKLQDGLYPIELTATLLPWQDIVGGNIDTDLTK